MFLMRHARQRLASAMHLDPPATINNPLGQSELDESRTERSRTLEVGEIDEFDDGQE